MHFECESRPGLGCLVYDTARCAHRPKGWARCRIWMRKSVTVEVWWVVLAVLPPLVVVCLWSLFGRLLK